MNEKQIGLQIVITSEDDGNDCYEWHLRTTEANLGQLSLMLACLHLLEKQLIEQIDAIEPALEVTKN